MKRHSALRILVLQINKWWCACEELGGIQVGVLTGTTDKEGIWEYIKYTISILNHSISYFTQKKLICMKLMMMKLTGMKKIPTQVIFMEMKTWQQLKYQREIIQLKYIYTMDAYKRNEIRLYVIYYLYIIKTQNNYRMVSKTCCWLKIQNNTSGQK